jgi:hypothetical protein
MTLIFLITFTMVFKNQPDQDFLIQELSKKRFVPHPNRLNRASEDSPKTLNKNNGDIALNDKAYSDSLIALIQLGLLDIPKYQQEEMVTYIKALDFEVAEKKQRYLQDIFLQYQAQQKMLGLNEDEPLESNESNESNDKNSFKFNPQTQKFLKVKYQQTKKYKSLLYILIWLAIIVTTWVYTLPLPPAYILKS